eukprot:3602591-Pyramimonas_sp.AAC.1
MGGGRKHEGQGQKQRNNARAALHCGQSGPHSEAAAMAQTAGRMVARLVLEERGLPKEPQLEEWG